MVTRQPVFPAETEQLKLGILVARLGRFGMPQQTPKIRKPPDRDYRCDQEEECR